MQKGKVRPWHHILPHFRLDGVPSTGAELQTEYLVPMDHAEAALRAVAECGELIAPLLQISEIRVIAPDRLWMSPTYETACVGIHFTWHPDWDKVEAVLTRIEEALSPFGARPHWGKAFTLSPTYVETVFKMRERFSGLLRKYDPGGKFSNAFMDAYIFRKNDSHHPAGGA